jgi:hypothetical protein
MPIACALGERSSRPIRGGAAAATVAAERLKRRLSITRELEPNLSRDSEAIETGRAD